MNISELVKKEEEYIVSLRRYFHAHPEASLKEYKTAAKIEEELKALGIPYERVGETGLIGYIGNPDKGKTIALRADIDALEIEEANDIEYKSVNKGLMHACGHDAHTASLLGAAKILKSKEDEINGYIKLIFQQAEEIGQGARQFIAKGHLKDVDNVFGLHVSSELDTGKIAVTPGPIAAACDYFKIKITGKSSHVSKPHAGVDALYIASQVVVNLQSIVSRETDPVDTVVVGIGVFNSGTRYNIVAKEAVLEGTFRTFSKESREKTQNSIERIVKSITQAHGGKAEIEFKAFANPVINDEASSLFAAKIAKNIVGEDNV
ncbi:MAG: amidohydrolase, partial [Tissierellia bacterium]|nr:amidohydrolase [Tissierellia bacterium]